MAISCSALKKIYRDILRAADERLIFVLLDGTTEILSERLRKRIDHFMPETLLQSQLATLERPDASKERAIIVSVTQSPQKIVDIVKESLMTICHSS